MAEFSAGLQMLIRDRALNRANTVIRIFIGFRFMKYFLIGNLGRFDSENYFSFKYFLKNKNEITNQIAKTF